MKDYYRILEVSPTATRTVIHAAYKALCLAHSKENDALKMYNEAKETLFDESKRASYDQSRNKKIKTIGQYRLISEIAAGGFGVTYKAEHLILGTPVCIKHASNISPQDEELMQDEARAMWDLRHWAIPSLREIVKLDDGSLAIVMSYIPGPTLEQVCKNGPIEYEHVCWITERVLNALRYLHDNGIAHGDVKPQNIIVQPDTHQVVLVDYGLSMMRPKSTSVNKGFTPYFAPPEQEVGGPLLPEADFYSLGMTMLYALGGDVMGKTIPSDVPDPICKFIKRLIVRDPLARPNWEKEDLCRTLSDLRQSVFGRRYSNMKPLQV